MVNANDFRILNDLGLQRCFYTAKYMLVSRFRVLDCGIHEKHFRLNFP